MAETLATHGNVEAVKYEGGSHHLHEIKADGKRGKQISSDEYIRQWGPDPNVRTSGNPEPVSIPTVETSPESAVLPAVAEVGASAREAAENINNDMQAAAERLDQILPEPERPDRRFQDGQRVRVTTGGDERGHNEVVEDNWEVVGITGRNEHNQYLYSVRSADGSRDLVLAEPHLENVQLAPTTPGEQLDQVAERLHNRVASADQRMGIDPTLAQTRVIPPVVEGNTATPAEQGAAPEDGRDSQIGNMIGNPGQNEVRVQDEQGQPHIYRRREDGSWEESRNGNAAHTWFPASPEDVARALGLEAPAALAEQPAETPAPVEGQTGETPPTPEELRFQTMENRIAGLEEAIRQLTEQLAGRAPAGVIPETPGEGEEVDAEAMDTALAELDAAMAAMDAGAADYAQARERLQRARDRVTGAWNGEQPPADDAGEVENDETAAIIAETDGNGPETPTNRRERLRKWGKRALGAAILAGVGVGAFFLGKHFGAHPTEIIQGPKNPDTPRKGVEHAAKLKTEQLSYYGDTVWAHGRATLAQAMGGKLPKDWQVYQWAKETMNLPGNKNHIMNSMGHWRSTWEGARHLPVGFHFRVSEAITKAIARGQG